MNRPKINIIDCETGEELVREMNDEEFANHQNIVAQSEENERLKVQAQLDKTALLSRLGITEDEAKLLLG